MTVNGEAFRADNEAVNEHGTLTVTWASPSAPWAWYRVLVDGVTLGRVRHRRSFSVDVPTGAHEVQLMGWRRYGSRVLSVDVTPGAHVRLEGKTGRLPAGMTGYRAIKDWAKEYGTTLYVENEAPPTFEFVRPYSAQRLGIHVAAVALFTFFALAAVVHHRWVGVALTLPLIAASAWLIRGELSRRHRST